MSNEEENRRTHDYKGRKLRKRTHRRYSDDFARPELRALALCNAGMNAKPHDEAYLTSHDDEVTCFRCLGLVPRPDGGSDAR